MSIREDKLKEFEDFFDLGVKPSGGEDEQAEEYGHSNKSDESFQVLIEEVSETIKKSEQKGQSMKDIHETIREVCRDDGSGQIPVDMNIQDISESRETVQSQENKVEEKPTSKLLDDWDFEDGDNVVEEKETKKDTETNNFFEDDLDVNVVDNSLNMESVVGVEKAETEEVSQIEEEEDTEEVDSEQEDANEQEECEKTGEVVEEISSEQSAKIPAKISSKDFEESTKCSNRTVEWKLDSPATLYNKFYEYKRKKLYDMLIGGPLPFGRLFSELDEIKIDLSSESFNKDEVSAKMEITQAYRERLKEIALMLYKQYYLWKRFIPIFEGKLAQIQYVKPVIKQQGLEGEHLEDCYTYMGLLEGLNDSLNITEKTLAAAYETLSRKVSIYMPLIYREITNNSGWLAPNTTYMPANAVLNKEEAEGEPVKKTPVKEEKEKYDFDKVPDGATVKNKSVKSGKVGWGDI